jgi:hypothetical protein
MHSGNAVAGSYGLAAAAASAEEGEVRFGHQFKWTATYPSLAYLPRTAAQVEERRQERLRRQQAEQYGFNPYEL